MEFFDEDGNAVEAVSPDEFKTLQEEKKGLETKLSDLKKLEDKDHNFEQVRKMVTDLEQQNKDLSEKMRLSQETAKEQIEAKAKLAIEEIQVGLLKELVGEDQEAMKKVMYHYERLTDEASTKEEIENKMKDAIKLANVESEASPLNRALGLSGESPKRKQDNFSESEEGQGLAKEMGLNFVKKEEKK